jgi:hypothetical protein
VRDAFFAARSYADLADLNRQAAQWTATAALERSWIVDRRRSARGLPPSPAASMLTWLSCRTRSRAYSDGPEQSFQPDPSARSGDSSKLGAKRRLDFRGWGSKPRWVEGCWPCGDAWSARGA